MYLMSLLPEVESIHFHYDLISLPIINYYNLDDFVIDGYVYNCINRAWYGLKQQGKIAHDDLVAHLNKNVYVRAGTTNRLFKHIMCNISFTLVVDNFATKHVNKTDIHHLITIMQEKYMVKVNFNAKQCISIHLNWNHDKHKLICSMKGYVQQALRELKHVPSAFHQAALSCVNYKQYGAQVQYVHDDETVLPDE